MFETLFNIAHVIVALFMILVVLVQGGHGGGVVAAFGGGSSSGVYGATGATSLLGKLTYAGAVVSMVTSVGLTIMQVPFSCSKPHHFFADISEKGLQPLG